MPEGEMRDLIDLHAVDLGVASLIEKHVMSFDEAMAIN